jgi:Domain of unknown function (DUF4232)
MGRVLGASHARSVLDRRTRTTAALVFAVCVPGITAACGSTSHRGSGPVPWVNRPVGRYEIPAPKMIPYPTSARACKASQLRVRQGRGGAAAGTEYERLVFTNVSGQPCLLRGFPTITDATASGARSPLPARREGFTFFQLVPADVRAGGHSYLSLATSGACNGGTNKPVIYRRLDITITGGGTLHAPANVQISDVCGLCISSFGLPARYTPLAPAPGTAATLRASVQLPKTVRAGSKLMYTITLSNRTTTTVKLTPCPGYNEGIYASGLVVRRWLSLNCATVQDIPAHGHVRFAMELSIPAKTPPGIAKFGWSLNTPTGPSVGRAITVRTSP